MYHMHMMYLSLVTTWRDLNFIANLKGKLGQKSLVQFKVSRKVLGVDMVCCYEIECVIQRLCNWVEIESTTL